MIVTCNDANCI